MAWMEEERESEILDSSFLTVTAKKESKTLKREKLFNGTKRALVKLMSTEVGFTLYAETFTRLWKDFTSGIPSASLKKGYEKYLGSILESVEGGP